MFTGSKDWRERVYCPSTSMNEEEYQNWKEISNAIIERDGRECQRCFKKYRGRTYLTAHHIIARKFGGTDEFGNLITLCRKCHNYVELYPDLNTVKKIMNSLDDPAVVEHGEEKAKKDYYEKYHKPWHSVVYGGIRNPKLDS